MDHVTHMKESWHAYWRTHWASLHTATHWTHCNTQLASQLTRCCSCNTLQLHTAKTHTMQLQTATTATSHCNNSHDVAAATNCNAGKLYNFQHNAALHCRTLQQNTNNILETATRCNTHLQHNATRTWCRNQNLWAAPAVVCTTLQHTATHSITQQHAATYSNTQHHRASHSNTQQHTATHYNTNNYNTNTLNIATQPQHTAAPTCNTLQQTPATQCNTHLQHNATHTSRHNQDLWVAPAVE